MKLRLSPAGYVLLLALLLAGFVGWCLNVYKIFGLTLDNIGEIVVRVVGVFVPPIGAIAGYF